MGRGVTQASDGSEGRRHFKEAERHWGDRQHNGQEEPGGAILTQISLHCDFFFVFLPRAPQAQSKASQSREAGSGALLSAWGWQGVCRLGAHRAMGRGARSRSQWRQTGKDRKRISACLGFLA